VAVAARNRENWMKCDKSGPRLAAKAAALRSMLQMKNKSSPSSSRHRAIRQDRYLVKMRPSRVDQLVMRMNAWTGMAVIQTNLTSALSVYTAR